MKRSKFSEEQITYARRHRIREVALSRRRFRILTVVAQWSRQAVLVEASYGYSGQAVAEVLERWLAERKAPASITVDHGTEFTPKALEAYAWTSSVSYADLNQFD